MSLRNVTKELLRNKYSSFAEFLKRIGEDKDAIMKFDYFLENFGGYVMFFGSTIGSYISREGLWKIYRVKNFILNKMPLLANKSTIIANTSEAINENRPIIGIYDLRKEKEYYILRAFWISKNGL